MAKRAAKLSQGREVEIDPDKFAAALERIASDPSVRKELDADPVKALEDMGIHIDSRRRAELAGKRLSATLKQAPTTAGGAAAFVAPVVQVVTRGTRPVVSVVVSSAVVIQVDDVMTDLSSKKITRRSKG